MTIKNRYSKEEPAKPTFVAPDGGWGWIIVFAVGFSNFCVFAVFLCFGLIFRERFEQLGINTAQTTTILNVNSAVTSFTGLANGPLFRTYSHRKVSLAGALISTISICALSYAENFSAVLILYSIMYGAGAGLAISAGALALNTYFEKKRTIAVGLAWTVTAVGPMISPQSLVYVPSGAVVAFTQCLLVLGRPSASLGLPSLATEGPIWRFGVRQPVWSQRCAVSAVTAWIVAFLMPIYGASGTCLLFGGFMFHAVACALLMQPVGKHARKESEFAATEATIGSKSIKDYSNSGLVRKDKEVNNPERRILNPENVTIEKPLGGISCEYIGRYLKSEGEDTRDLINGARNSSDICTNIAKEKMRLPWPRKLFRGIIVFFDFDLLRDPVYVNLMLGVNISNFAEFNFIFLSPYIFFAYNLTESQVATTMSAIAGVDLATRVMIPFVATRVGFQNKTYYLIGTAVAAIGRLVIAHVETYSVIMTMSILMGIGRALTIIFQALVIPTHVPLERLPAGWGIQMVTGGLIFLMLGPIIGWIRDACGNYTSVLYFLDFLSGLTIASWTLQAWCCSEKR